MQICADSRGFHPFMLSHFEGIGAYEVGLLFSTDFFWLHADQCSSYSLGCHGYLPAGPEVWFHYFTLQLLYTDTCRKSISFLIF